MSAILMVPIHLDALLLRNDRLVTEATADFTRLPYTRPTGDVNANTANLSENIVSPSFQNQNLFLKAGVHLHWALPDALTRAVHADQTVFPAVPNRWLVSRSFKGDDGTPVVKRWVVESDYLFPEGEGADAGGVSIPTPPEKAAAGHPPFRYLGRKTPLEIWNPANQGSEYLPTPLTAIGYGEPTFAAFYPNCHSVFGFHDDLAATGGVPPADLRYDVVGWYGDGETDPLDRIAKLENPPAALSETYAWAVEIAAGQEFPARMLCYARLTFDPETAEGNPENPAPGQPAEIALGSTGTEALIAYLGGRIGGGDPKKAADLEDRLEAVMLSSRLEHRALDVAAKLAEARHENGFVAVPGGTLWSIRRETVGPAQPADAASRTDQESTLPDDLAHLLNAANALQQDYDRLLAELASDRRQLFADWYKYMLCAYPPDDAHDDYPDVDEVRYFIERKIRAPLHAKLAATGALLLAWGEDDAAASPDARPLAGARKSDDSRSDSVAAALAAALQSLVDALAGLPRSGENAKDRYVLKPIPAPRFWQPCEPVVLMKGPALEPTDRHGQDGRLRDDGLLDCDLLPGVTLADLIPDDPARIEAWISRAQDRPRVAFRKWTEQPWHPLRLEWEVGVFPIEWGNNLDADDSGYAPDFVAGNYALPADAPDLAIRPDRVAVTRAANVYSGATLLTSHARPRLAQRLREFLGQENGAAGADQTLRDALAVLEDPGFHCQSQALGGFNEALLMHKQTLQLPIADPLAFSGEGAFTDGVRDDVEKENRSAPLPLDDFNPIRSGVLKPLRLRLVDSFGQTAELDCSRVLTTVRQTIPENAGLIRLAPRLVQPARLNFRWLSAESDERETNDHPATTPICGWIVPNSLDNRLAFYDNRGKALGSVSQAQGWQAAPGAAPPLAAPDDIPDLHLRRVVRYLVEARERDAGFLGAFQTALENALRNIEPETYAEHPELALLMGRPIAVARAALDLQLLGSPAVHEAWNAFRQDLRRNHRDTDAFSHVRFPIRLGERKQLGDGLVGFWKETAEGGFENGGDSVFYAPRTDGVNHPRIQPHGDGSDAPSALSQSVEAPPQLLTLLVDPRGSVHATCGVQPTKAIRIPPDQYAPALRAIEVAFLIAPLLTDLGFVHLPLADEPGYRWSWLENDGDAWSEVSADGAFARTDFLKAFAAALGDTAPGGEAVWQELTRSGWLVPVPGAGGRFRLADKSSRSSPDLPTGLAERVETEALSRFLLGEVTTQAVFSGPQEIREGWLTLRAVEAAE